MTPLSASDKKNYSPFGVVLEGRTFSTEEYRYGFNGFEVESAEYGLLSAAYRWQDSRLGQWFSIDPMYNLTPGESPYSSMSNSPIQNHDPDGDVVVSAIVGFFKGLFASRADFLKPGGSRLKNAFNVAGRDAMFSAKIYAGIIKSDNTRTLGGKILQVASKLTWELPQTLLGIAVGNLSVNIGVESVDYSESGATMIRRPVPAKYKSYWEVFAGVTLGSYVNYMGGGTAPGAQTKVKHLANQHELGHYEQSKIYGPFYLFIIGLPSLISSMGNNHANQPWEQGADKRALDYWNTRQVRKMKRTTERYIKNPYKPKLK